MAGRRSALPAHGAAFTDDPRHAGLGLRGVFDTAPDMTPPCPQNRFGRNGMPIALSLGVAARPRRHAAPARCFRWNIGFQHMQAIDFQKGCFIGQEVTSRTHRKGSVCAKKLHSVRLDWAGTAPEAPAAILWRASVLSAQMVAVDRARMALAIIREDALALTLDARARRRIQPCPAGCLAKTHSISA